MTAARREMPSETAPREPAGPKALLVPVDLTPAADRVLGRVVKLPLDERAVVTLLHVVPGSLQPRDQRIAERDARQALAGEARHMARALPKSVRIESRVMVGSTARCITDVARAQAVELVVMGRGGGRVLRDIFLGSTAERVIRLAKVPVLAVRLAPRAAYRRPALAVDLDGSAPDIIRWLLRMMAAPRPALEAIHAVRAPYEGLVYPSMSQEEVEERRAELRREAAIELGRTLKQAGAAAVVPPWEAEWRLHVRYGSPRGVVKKAVQQGKLDLLALGTHGYSGAAHLFLGSVAGDLLREVGCDVLVVPPPRRRRGSA